MRNVGPATVATIGPNSVKPIANAAFRVSVKMPLAAVSWARGTSSGIMLSSAGAKKVVAIETATLKKRITPTFVWNTAIAKKKAARSRLVVISTRRRSNRST